MEKVGHPSGWPICFSLTDTSSEQEEEFFVQNQLRFVQNYDCISLGNMIVYVNTNVFRLWTNGGVTV